MKHSLDCFCVRDARYDESRYERRCQRESSEGRVPKFGCFHGVLYNFNRIRPMAVSESEGYGWLL